MSRPPEKANEILDLLRREKVMRAKAIAIRLGRGYASTVTLLVKLKHSGKVVQGRGRGEYQLPGGAVP